MKKLIALLIPVTIIVIFILIMNSASYLKQSFGENDNVPVIIEEIKNDVNNDDWAGAKQGTKQLEDAWKIISKRVQFGANREEIILAKSSIARVKGFIEAGDKGGALAELYEVKEHWTYIGL